MRAEIQAASSSGTRPSAAGRQPLASTRLVRRAVRDVGR
jgi:hypothetical protein